MGPGADGRGRLMAGHVQDRWYKVERGPDGKTVRTKTERHGTGMRYRARYIGPDGSEKSMVAQLGAGDP
ncbi:hypothetical protein AB0D90_33560, partial [Streptomyces althioticus]